MDALVVDLSGGLDWIDFDIPGGSEPVGLARLRLDAEGGPTSLVRFPAGWHRSADGAYEVGEEFTVLTGALHMSGAIYVAPHWVYAPANYPRARTHMHEETLSVARFEGKARWRDGEGDDMISVMDAPVLGPPRELRPGTTWLVDGVASEPSPFDRELLSPGVPRWAWIPAGEVPPEMPGPVIERRVG